MSMTKIKDPDSLVKFGNLFLTIVRGQMDAQSTPPTKAFAALATVHRLLTSGDETGFVVYNHEETMGPQHCDLFREDDDTEFLQKCMEDALLFSRDDVSFRDIDHSRRTFIATLCRQVLFGLPSNNEEATAFILRQIAATFNGMNIFHCKFMLTYCGVENDTDTFETDDVSDYIIL